MRLKHSLVVARPIEEVFEFVADPANLHRWQTGAIEVTKQSDEPGMGARHVEVRSVLGQRIVQTLEVTADEPWERLDLGVVEGPLDLRVSHRFQPEQGGTRIDVVGEGDPGPFFRMAGPFLSRAVERQSKRDFTRLKRLLESP
jgi:carbon monoxide dehydrogenase subunit G